MSPLKNKLGENVNASHSMLCSFNFKESVVHFFVHHQKGKEKKNAKRHPKFSKMELFYM
jgi:succinylarginine dihydrolase